MKFKIYATLSVWAYLIIAAICGIMPLGAALVLFVIASAALTPYRTGLLCACPDLWDALRVPTEFLGAKLHSLPSPETPYYDFAERGIFESHTGVEHTTFTGGRVEPTSKSAGWSDVTLANNIITGAGCSDNFLEIPVGFDEATFGLRKLQLKGPPICKENLAFTHNPRKFIQGHYIPRLGNYVKRAIDLEFRDQTMKLGSKVSATENTFGTIFSGLTNPTINPTSQLTWDQLDMVSARLIRDGAVNVDGMTTELGPMGPVWPINIGLEMLSRLFNNVPSILANFQQAFMGRGKDSPTLLPVGASIAVKNFRFNPVTVPPRGDFVGGIIVEREAFENVAATHGEKSEYTSAYINAELEAAVIPHKKQFNVNVANPDDAGLDFDPTSWSGAWKFVTGVERIVAGCAVPDPLHKWGQHFSEYFYAPEPIHPNIAWTIWYRRCPNQQAVASCGSSGA